jgi:AcrR family transcriptional regulator
MECLSNPCSEADGNSSHVAAPGGICENASAERIARIVSIAKILFGERGYAATTMDDIAGAAGMSKKTLYKLFENKSDLFREMLTRNLHKFEFRPEEAAPRSAMVELRRALRHIADLVFRPEEVALHRLLIAERKQSPALTAIFTEVIFNSGSNRVVSCLERLRLKEAVASLPLRSVADMIVGSIFSKEHFRAMVDDAYRVDQAMLDARIEAALHAFCEDRPSIGEVSSSA